MQTPESHMELKSGRFSIEKYHYENIGLSERMVSMFLSGVLMTRGIKKPFKGQFLCGAYMAYRAFTGRCLIYEQLGIDASKPRAVNIRGSFEIARPAAEVYAYWRNLKDLPGRIKHLLDIKIKDDQLSHWKAAVMGNLFSVDWDAEIVKDEPGQLIGWRAAQGSIFQHVGRIQFEETEDGQATVMKMVLSYHPPIGGLGLGLARLLNPYFESLLKKEIKNFKYAIESVNGRSQVELVPPVLV
ncbi:SRPBCC family protein [Pedobacter sp. GR22-6]|uniref:SRPBCC family protein n=1 Tax=Pedobacter sp. GR22-6 TaxID=3127957 RepID=UPI00307DE04C